MARGTYTVRSGDNWFKIAQRVFGDQNLAARLADKNPGVTLSPGVVIKTRGIATRRRGGGAALAARFPGVSPTGVPGGVGAITPTEEVPGVTPAGERPPAELAPQALMGDVEGIAARGFAAAPTPPPLGEPLTMAGLTGAEIGPRRRGAPGAFGMGPVSMPTGEPLVTVGEGVAGPFGRPSPATTPSIAPTTAEPFVTIGEGVAGPFGRGPLGPTLAQPGAEYVRPTPAGEPEVVDTTIMPIAPGSPQATTMAARWTGLAIAEYGRTGNRNFLPEVITTPVALHLTGWLETAEGEDILTVNNLFSSDNLSYTEIEPGVWAKNPEVTYTGGYTGAVGYAGRRYGRGRGTRGGRTGGAGGTQYGPRLTQWRIGFGG